MTQQCIKDKLPIRETSFSPWPYYDEDEISAAMAVLKSGAVNSWSGQNGPRFEEEYAAAVVGDDQIHSCQLIEWGKFFYH